MGWLNTSTGAGSKEATKPSERVGGGPFRFWVEKGGKKQIIFLTSGDEGTAPVIQEHFLRLGGRWSSVTCYHGESKPCPLCLVALEYGWKYEARRVQLFTVLDLTEFVDKKGVKHTSSVKLLAAPPAVADHLGNLYLECREKGKTLKYAKYGVVRGASDKTPNVGDQWFYKEHVEPTSLPKDAEEIDYEKELKPNYDLLKTLADKINTEQRLLEDDLPEGLRDKAIEY